MSCIYLQQVAHSGSSATTSNLKGILSRVKRPTSAQTSAISKYFSGKKHKGAAIHFVPAAPLVVESQKRKKKKAIPPKKPKPTNKTVVMMKKAQLKVNYYMSCGIVLHVDLMYTNLHLGP